MTRSRRSVQGRVQKAEPTVKSNGSASLSGSQSTVSRLPSSNLRKADGPRGKRVHTESAANDNKPTNSEESETSWRPDESSSVDMMDKGCESGKSLGRKRRELNKKHAQVRRKERVGAEAEAAEADRLTERARSKPQAAEKSAETKQLKLSEITYVFDEIRDKHRSITARELMNAIVAHLGQQEADQMTDEDIISMIRQADSNGDGKVDKEEFERFVLKEIRL
ncbi:hypothetical protein F1559_002719 [Cyanidiococcus yangmingshanensis]|uniref:EF-hand domain-containing protein n=1 Tax=Cyanidiococcus yangmingshanensis TaxID=2690220 RepID=A0A7J7IMQ1_9RHOD|nr:hypothetical protein F1559_002719 [Cyanidiococcus yangmingshanensis]